MKREAFALKFNTIVSVREKESRHPQIQLSAAALRLLGAGGRRDEEL